MIKKIDERQKYKRKVKRKDIIRGCPVHGHLKSHVARGHPKLGECLQYGHPRMPRYFTFTLLENKWGNPDVYPM